MASGKQFKLEILTPLAKILSADVTDVVLPAFDGERGVLGEHENFIGRLGTGALKYVKDGDDYWLMVSSGVYQVIGGDVMVLAEVGDDASFIDADSERLKLRTLEERLSSVSSYSDEHLALKQQAAQIRARLDVHHRTQVVN